MRVGIVGYGVVGRALERLFRAGGHHYVEYDKYKDHYTGEESKDAVNSAQLVFVAVPTPQDQDGACNLAEVEDVMSWVLPPVCLKSTVIPGTTKSLEERTGKKVAFSPEYTGETPFHMYRTREIPEVVAVGGNSEVCELVLSVYRKACGSEPHYFVADASTIELAKYMENCFLAAKVAFVAQFYLLAKQFGADFTMLREIWVADSRIGRSHSMVIDKPGYDGRCLPKDMRALIAASGAPLLRAIDDFNTTLRGPDGAG